MNEGADRPIVVLLKAMAALTPILIYAYVTEPRVRWAVDQVLGEARYRWQVAGWRARWWDPLTSWERERVEEMHGRP